MGIALFPLLWRGLVVAVYERKIYPPTAVPTEQVAIVYGAAVYSTRLSSVLRDRMETAVFLYEQGKVSKLLVSGGTKSRQRCGIMRLRGDTGGRRAGG